MTTPTESIPTSSPQTSPSVNLTPPVAKRKVEMFTIQIPTATGSDSQTVDRQTYEKFTRLDAIYMEMSKAMTDTQCIREMMTRAQSPEEINAVHEFYALKFQFKDAK